MIPVEMVLVLAIPPDPAGVGLSRGASPEHIVRGLLEHHRGEALDHTDSFLLRLPDVAAALSFAADLHATPGWQVGVHRGPALRLPATAEARAHGAKAWEIEGLAKPVVARVAALCPPGRTLVTDAAAAALGDDRGLRPHGWWALKGVERPLALWEPVPAGAAAPPLDDHPKAVRMIPQGEGWVPASALRAALPAELDSFVGREVELDTLLGCWAAGARLLTLLGPGGAGKTRLARRLAWAAVPPGGVWFCDLSLACSEDEIWATLARTLDLAPGREALAAQVGRALAGRGPCLGVLDNTEQATDAARRVVRALREAAPEAALVVTTRELLDLPGEQVLRVEALDPAAGQALFVARAAALGARGGWDAAAQAEIREIVKELDGLPLAIELAAARARLLTPARIRERLSARFALLAGARGANPRHVTLRASIDGSWEGLNAAERAAFARLAVFGGPFEAAAAQAVAGCGAELLTSLAQRSLVRPPAQSGEGYRLPHNLAEYAREKLADPDAFPGSGPQALLAAEQAHGAWHARLGQEEALVAEEATEGAPRSALLEDLRLACTRAAGRGEAAIAVACARAAWATGGLPYREALRLLDLARASGPLDAALARGVQVDRAELLRLLGEREDAEVAVAEAMDGAVDLARVAALAVRASLAGERGALAEAEADLATAVACAEGVGAGARAAQLRVSLGTLLREHGRIDEAEQVLRAALGGSGVSRAGRLSVAAELGAVCILQGRLPEAVGHLRDAYAEAVALDLARPRARLGLNLGGALRMAGETAASRPYLEGALAAFRRLGDARGVGLALYNLASLARTAGAHADARRLLEEAREGLRLAGHHNQEAMAVAVLGELALEQGDLVRADGLLAEARALAAQISNPSLEGYVAGLLGRCAARRGDRTGALAALDEGEALLRGCGDQLHLGDLRAWRAEAFELLGAREDAAGAPAEAGRIG